MRRIILFIGVLCLLSTTASAQIWTHVASTAYGALSIPGNFTAPANTVIFGFRLWALGGGVWCCPTCNTSPTFWGCPGAGFPADSVNVFVTDVLNSVIVPVIGNGFYVQTPTTFNGWAIAAGWYSFSGSSQTGTTLTLPTNTPYVVGSSARPMRVQYGEALFNAAVGDNGGLTTMNVSINAVCAAGFFGSPLNCLTCTTGNYCPQNSTTPIACPIGTYNPNTGGTSLSSCLACGLYTNCTSAGTTSPPCIPAPPALDTVNSRLLDPNITIVLTASAAYSSVVARFGNGLTPGCNSDVANSLWLAPSTTACTTSLTISAPINTMIANCSFTRDESTVDRTVFSSVIQITAVDNLGTVRGVPLTQTVVTAVTVTFSFDTFLNATASTMPIFGSVLTFAAVTNQSFDPLTATATLTLFTSSQYPYQLWAPAITPVANFISSVVAINLDLSAVGNNVSACNATNTDQFVANSACTQSWRIVIRASNSCPTQTNLTNSGWVLQYQVRCHSSFGGSCNSPSPSNVSLTFDTATDNYCARFISNTVVPTLSLQTFQNAQLTQTQGAFVFGTRTFFNAIVASPVQISNAHFERIALTAGAAAGVTDLYTKTFTNAGAFFAATGTYAGTPTAFNLASTQMTISEFNGSPSLQQNISFSWIWNNLISSASSDDSVPTTVFVAVRIRYANVTTVGAPDSQLLHFKFSTPNKYQSLEAGSVAASNTFLVSAGPTNTVNPTTGGAQASSSALSSQLTVLVAGMAVGCVAAATVVVAIIVVRKRNRRQQGKIEATETEMVQSVELEAETVQPIELASK